MGGKFQILSKSVLLGSFLALAACQTSGVDGLFGGGTAKSSDPLPDQQVATAQPQTGRNPNFKPTQINTQNALSDYCPAVRIRSGTESFRVVPKGKDKEDPNSVRYQASITKVARECAYVGQNLEIKVGARGRIITGPAAGNTGSVSMPIRVAVTEGGETIYSKLHKPGESFAEGDTNKFFSFVDDQVVIPAPKRTNVRVYIGFDEGPYNTP